ncbi:hypothetical protein [Acidihalobacter prosperus]|nr:hypothetical protein [Acidihalobacter prosperus]
MPKPRQDPTEPAIMHAPRPGRRRLLRPARIRDSLLGGLVLGNWIVLFDLHQHLLEKFPPAWVWMVLTLDYAVPALLSYFALLALPD